MWSTILQDHTRTYHVDNISSPSYQKVSNPNKHHAKHPIRAKITE